jgi:type II secretory pathway pseudopilin PulG
MAPTSSIRQQGFTVIEAVIASALLVVLATGIARLVVVAVRGATAARHETSTVILAAQKIEQLRSLIMTWEPGGAGWPLTDVSTDVGADPMVSGGRGLLPSPPDTLTTNVTGYVDYLDGRGRSLGTGSTPPAGAVYVRRWNVARWSSAPDDVVAIQVLVTTARRAAAAAPPGWRPAGEDALLVTLRSRKSAGGVE